MPIFQYYNPYRKPYYYNNYRPNYNRNFTSTNLSNYAQNISNNNLTFENNDTIENNVNKNENRSKTNPNEEVWLDILGIKLYFDDVLILSLLFFLYQEEVKDEGLFLALILLLIS